VLHAVLRHHPDQAWVRERLRKILGAALTGGGVDFGEMAPLAAAFLSAKARGADAHSVMDDYDAATDSAIGQLLESRGERRMGELLFGYSRTAYKQRAQAKAFSAWRISRD
jgi:hypothetical protein